MRMNRKCINEVRKDFCRCSNIKWIIGGSCSGKTTLCRALAKHANISLYDMDEHIFGDYMRRYTKEDYPANSAWFSAENPLDWALSLSLEDFDKFNKEANLEYLRLFSEDMIKQKDDSIVLVDGGIAYPEMLSKIIPVDNIICLSISIEESEWIWETADSKKSMKSMISRLPEPEQKWKKFLECNKLITDTILKEARDCGIEIIDRDNASVDRLKNFVISPF